MSAYALYVNFNTKNGETIIYIKYKTSWKRIYFNEIYIMNFYDQRKNCDYIFFSIWINFTGKQFCLICYMIFKGLFFSFFVKKKIDPIWVSWFLYFFNILFLQGNQKFRTTAINSNGLKNECNLFNLFYHVWGWL